MSQAETQADDEPVELPEPSAIHPHKDEIEDAASRIVKEIMDVWDVEDVEVKRIREDKSFFDQDSSIVLASGTIVSVSKVKRVLDESNYELHDMLVRGGGDVVIELNYTGD
jgi:hypothetical protein